MAGSAGNAGGTAEPQGSDGLPRWVTVLALIAAVLVLLAVLAVVLTGGPGEHGPGRHPPGGQTPTVEQPAGQGPPPGRLDRP